MKKQSQEYNNKTLCFPHILFCYTFTTSEKITNSNKYEFSTINFVLHFILY